MTELRSRAAAWLRPAAAPLVLGLLAIAYISPIWVSRLSAPQYPKGLWLTVYGGRISGDVAEINGLNHYIGMRVVSQDAVPELGVWWLAVVSSAVFAIGSLFLAGRLRAVARVGAWLVPIAVIADIQRWLYTFGQHLDPEAALRVPSFVPLAIGPTQVWNFGIWAMPGPGLIALFAVALLVTLVRHPALPSRPVRFAASAAALLFVGAVTLEAAPGQAAAPSSANGQAQPAPPFDLVAAVASAPDGSEVHVPAGRYGRLIVRRSIALIGHGDAILDGAGTGTVLTIAAPGVTVRGLVITRSGGQLEDAAGIEIRADGAAIEGNVLRDVYVGVLARGARNVRLVGNTIAGAGGADPRTTIDASHGGGAHPMVGDGIWLHDTESALVRGNDISGMRDGIYLSYARETLVDTNHLHDLRYAIHSMFGADLMVFGNEVDRNASGLVLMNTAGLEASRNVIVDQRSEATGYGVLLKDVERLRMVENVLARDRVALRAEGVDSTRSTADILLNDFQGNTVAVQLYPSARLVFSRNSFVDNLVNVDTPGAAAPNRSEWIKSGAGNYWDRYAGYDLNGDSIGDIAHIEGTSADRLVTVTPELRALRSSLAFSILARAERWWDVAQAPRLTDRLPLVAPLAPTMPDPAVTAADGAVWLAAAAALLLALVAASALARRA